MATDTRMLAREYGRLRDSGESERDAAAMVDAMMIGDYVVQKHWTVEAKRARYERRAQAEKHSHRPDADAVYAGLPVELQRAWDKVQQ